MRHEDRQRSGATITHSPHRSATFITIDVRVDDVTALTLRVTKVSKGSVSECVRVDYKGGKRMRGILE